MKVEFRYGHPVSASTSASTPSFLFSPSLCAGKLDPEALGQPNQRGRIGDFACRRLMTLNPVLRTPFVCGLDLAVRELHKRPGVLQDW